MNAFNQNSIPVAPEFVDVLRIRVLDTLERGLKKIGAPEVLIDLTVDVYLLMRYQELARENPEALNGDNPRFDGADAVIQTINHIAEAGGVFHSFDCVSEPRPGTLLAEADITKATK